MSETVHYKGILRPIKLEHNETIQSAAQKILKQRNYKYFKEIKQSYDNNYVDCLIYEFYREYIFSDNVLYKVTNEKINVDDDIAHSSRNENGSISYEIKYYNGGAGFNEMIDEALLNLK